MGSGVIRSYQQATTLRQMPVNLIGVAIATAFFPKMTEDLGEGKEEEYRASVRSALRMIIFIALPVSVIAYFSRGYVVNFIVNGGDELIANILGASIAAIFFGSVFHIATRGFYARQDTKTPLVVSIVAIGLNIVLAIVFSTVWHFGPEGLAWATVIGSALEVVILLAILHFKSSGLLLNRRFWGGLLRMVGAAVISGCVAYSMTKFFPLMDTDDSFFVTFPKFVLIAATAFLAYVIAGYFMNVAEVRPVVDRVKKIVFRNTK
jgi:putative peptidoglycan lipid II flippase